MEIVYDLVVVLHFLGLASLVGGWLVQLRSAERQVNPAMLHGALTQLVTGLALVGIGEASLDEQFDYAKITTKLVIVLVITLLVWVNRRKASIPTGLYLLVGGLSIANVAIAVLW